MCESGHVFEKIHKKGALYLVKALDKKRWYEVEKNGGNSRCLRSQDMRHLEQSGGKAFKSQKKNVGKIKIGGVFAISGQQVGEVLWRAQVSINLNFTVTRVPYCRRYNHQNHPINNSCRMWNVGRHHLSTQDYNTSQTSSSGILWVLSRRLS